VLTYTLPAGLQGVNEGVFFICQTPRSLNRRGPARPVDDSATLILYLIRCPYTKKDSHLLTISKIPGRMGKRNMCSKYTFVSFPTISSERGIGRRSLTQKACIQYRSDPAFFSIKACTCRGVAQRAKPGRESNSTSNSSRVFVIARERLTRRPQSFFNPP